MIEVDARVGRFEPDVEADAEQRDRRPCRPGLRRAGNWIGRWALRALAREAAEQFRQPAQVEESRGGEQAVEYLQRLALESVCRKSRRDDCIVMRPNGAVVIAHRVEARLAFRHG